MRNRIRLVGVLVIVLFIVVGLLISPAIANSPLPGLPAQAILNKVISETRGPTFSALGVPNAIKSQLQAFSGPFSNMQGKVDFDKAISYFDRSGTLNEIAIPLKDNGQESLSSTFTTSDGQGAKVVGALWQRGRGTMVMVITFTDSQANQLRFYTSTANFIYEGMYLSRFVDYSADGRLETVDRGALIAKAHSCVSVGLNQVCWSPYNDGLLRDQGVPDVMQAALNRAYARYQIQVGFNTWATVPDLIGASNRTACANQFRTASAVNNLSACQANLVVTHTTSTASGQPIGLWIVTAAANLKAYRTNGTYTGSVPVGEYLVIDATPSLSAPGQVGVLFLVNIASNDHYLVPSLAMQGFANSDSIDEWQVAIKDGTMRFRGW